MNLIEKDKIDTISFDTIDSFLGDSKARYFSSGYKSIKYVFEDILLQDDKVIGILQVHWPQKWAQKNKEVLTPHLGSLELFVIAAHLVELYLQGIDNMSENDIENSWIEVIKINSGIQAISHAHAEECECVKNSSVFIDNDVAQSHFSIKIVSTQINITIRHKIHAANSCLSVKRIKLLSQDFSTSFFSFGYKIPICNIHNIHLSIESRRAEAQITILNQELLHEFKGMGRAYQPFFNISDGILVVGQLTQTLLYNLDGLTRDNTSNLWMRYIESHYNTPILVGEKISLSIHAEEFKTLHIKKTLYRVSTIHISIAEGKITGKIKVAHQI